MNAWTFALGGTVFLGLFLAASALAGSGTRSARALLALLLGSVSAFLMEFLLMQSGYYGWPVVFVTYPLAFVMGPAFYLLARSQTGDAPPLRPRDALHALPLVVMTINQLPYYADALAAGTARGLVPECFVALGGYEMMLLHLAQLGVYAFLGRRLLRARARTQGDVDSGAVVHQARWIGRVATGFAVIIALQFVWAIVMLATGIHIDDSEYGMALAIAAVILSIGASMLRHARLLVPPAAPAGAKARSSSLSADRLAAYRTRLLGHFAAERPYLDADLRLESLARATGIPEHHLSQTLNAGMNITFFDFVNRCRVRHAAGLLLADPEAKGTILAVAFDSGFSSKASFNRAFKAHTGTTPSAFRAAADVGHPILAAEGAPAAAVAARGAAPGGMSTDGASHVPSPEIRSHPAT